MIVSWVNLDIVFQVSSVHLLEKQFHQANVVAAITARLGLSHPHRRTKGHQVVHVLKVITVHRDRQHHCPVQKDITTTKTGVVIFPTVCLVLQVYTHY